MAWKEIRQEPAFRQESFFGECPRFHKQAKIIGHYVGTRQAKTDLSITYRLSGYVCDLCPDEALCPCAENCSVMPPGQLN